MSKLVKVKTVGAIINGQPIGSTVEVTEAEAEYFTKLGYVEPVKETPKAEVKTESKAKPKSKATAKKSTKDK